MMEYFLYYLLSSLVVLLIFCIAGRAQEEPIESWNADETAALLFGAFMPVFGLAALFIGMIWPLLTKERTFKREKTFMKDSMLKGIGDDTIQIE